MANPAYFAGSSCVSGGWREQQFNQRTQQCFAPFSNIVNELKEPQVKRQFLLRNPLCGRSQDLNRDQKPSIVLTWTSQNPSPSSSRANSPAEFEQQWLEIPRHG